MIKATPLNKNVCVAASGGQRKALALITTDGGEERCTSTGLSAPFLAAHEALTTRIDVATAKPEPPDSSNEAFTQDVGVGCDTIDQYHRA
ncbi:MAG TPA: hypothetical protein VFP34_16025 [Microlunatus sp.]|nr:hypothetical protein [Microlunatus sp.]